MQMRYWTRQALLFLLQSLLGGVIFFAVTLLQGTGQSPENLLQTSCLFFLFLASGMQIVVYAALYKLHIPLLLSFGATRKQVFWGQQFYRLLVAALLMVLFILVSRLIGPADGMPLSILFGVCLVFGAMGSLSGMLANRFGVAVLIIMTILFAVSIGFLSFFLVSGSFTNGIQVPLLSWLLPVIGVLAHLIMTIPEQKIIGSLVVRL